MKIKTIPSRWPEQEGRRLDCGPYMSGAIEAKDLIRRLSANKEPLQNLTTGIYHAGRESRLWVESPEHGVPFMGSTDILASDLSNLPLLSKNQVASNPNFTIREGWTLITRSGTIGRMAYARSDMDGLACSEHVMRVVPDNNKILPGYIYAYLSSRFGVPLVVSGTYGSIIQSIEPNHIADLPVPRLGRIEEQVHKLIQKAADLRVDATQNVFQATEQFLASAGLQEISSNEWYSNSGRLGFSENISKMSLRAVNYIPLNQELRERIKSQSPSWRPLGEIAEPGTLRTGPRFKRIDSDPEFAVELIGQKDIFSMVPEGRWISKRYLPNDNLIFVPEGAILIAAQGGLKDTDTFAKCQFVYGKRLKYAYSQHFMRVIADETEIKRGTLFAYLRSNLAFRLLRGCAIGSMQQDFHPELIGSLPVPIIDSEQEQEIDSLVRDAYEKYDKAIDCEDEARLLVETAIEEGGR